MLGKNLVETIMGVFVLLVAAIFLGFAYFSADLAPPGGYQVSAQFGSVDGLTVGSDVRIGGVKVGIVSRETIDPQDYKALIVMDLQPSVRLPVDSKAAVASAGLLGGSYIKLVPGQSASMIAPGGEIKNTENAIVLEELLGKIIFLATDQGGSDQGTPKAGAGPGPGPAPAPTPTPAPAPGAGNGAPAK